MADKLGLGTGVHDLKIGQSFFNAAAGGPAGRGRGGPGPGGRGRQGAPQGAQALPSYHTIRYDFKPASSSTSSSGFLSVDPETQGVKVTVPHENGDSQTNFSGHQKKANEKECILVIDRVTGEITLEKLSSQILVKKTRAEKPDRANHQQNFIQQRQQQKQQQQLQLSSGPTLPQHQPGNDKTAGKHRVGTSRPINPLERSQSPAGGAGSMSAAQPRPPERPEPMQPPPSLNPQKQKQQQHHPAVPPAAAAAAPTPPPQSKQRQMNQQQQQVASKYPSEELSSGSSGSDSSSSDGDGDDSDDDDTNEATSSASKTQSSSTSSMPSFGGGGGSTNGAPSAAATAGGSAASSGSMPSFGTAAAGGNSGASMPDFLTGGASADHTNTHRQQQPHFESSSAFQSNNIGHRPNQPAPSAQKAAPTMSMPQVLGNDLQLSESDSD